MSRIIRFEKYFFLLVALVNLVPLFFTHYFVTLDGPAHLHNARLIANLAGNSMPSAGEYYVINSYLTTNWSGHLILMLFHWVAPAWLAEKALIALILVCLPFAFRFFVSRVTGASTLLTYLIFPFTWSQLLIFGFYNHLLGMIAVFVVLGLWMGYSQKRNVKNGILLFAAFSFAAVSHIFTFLIAFTLAAGWLIWSMLLSHRANREHADGQGFSGQGKNWGFLFLTASGGMLVLALFLVFLGKITGDDLIKTTLMQSIHDIRTLKPLWVLYSSEQMFTAKLFYWLGMMSLAALVIRAYRIIISRNGLAIAGMFKSGMQRADYLALAALATFVFFVIHETWFNTGLFVGSRLIFLAFVLWIAWIAVQKFHPAFSVITVIAVLFLNFFLMSVRLEGFKTAGKIADEFIEMSEYPEAGSIIYPVNFSPNWLMFHLTNYLGADKPLILLHNYECALVYFPLQWKQDKLGLKITLDEEYPDIITVMPDGTAPYDYLLTFAHNGVENHPDYRYFKTRLAAHFNKIAGSPSGMIQLYRLRKQ